MTQPLYSAPGSPLSAASIAPVLTPTFATATAAQLSDLTRDYQIYLNVTTSGTATSVTMGPTSAASAVTIMASAAATAGQVISFRLPAGTSNAPLRRPSSRRPLSAADRSARVQPQRG